MYYDEYEALGNARACPPLRTHAEIIAAGSTAQDLLGDGKKAEVVSQITKGVMGVSPLDKLPYFDIATMTIPDMMHITAGVVGAHFFKMVMSNKMPGQLKALQAKVAAATVKEDERASAWFQNAEAKHLAARAKHRQSADRIKAGKGDHAALLRKLGPEPPMPVWERSQQDRDRAEQKTVLQKK